MSDVIQITTAEEMVAVYGHPMTMPKIPKDVLFDMVYGPPRWLYCVRADPSNVAAYEREMADKEGLPE